LLLHPSILTAYAKELKDLNTEITQRIEVIEQKVQAGFSALQSNVQRDLHTVLTTMESKEDDYDEDPLLLPPPPPPSNTNDDDDDLRQPNREFMDLESSLLSTHPTKPAAGIRGTPAQVRRHIAMGATRMAHTAVGTATSVANTAVGTATSAVGTATSAVNTAVGTAAALVAGVPDGDYYSGGFVSFQTLSLTNAALQMVHYGTPFRMEVRHAPDPDDSTYICAVKLLF